MKRLVLLLLLSTAPAAQAADLAETWKTISSYRIASFVKAAICAAAIYHTTSHAAGHGHATFTAAQGYEGRKGFEQAAITTALAYATFYFFFDHLWPHTKHALAIK